ncbi:MAG: ribosome biogenesis factor YjgA [Methylococcales bacterium]|nr:ribosome biogenesis factor YjgA [Methylococcales bacterium]
MIDEEDDLEGYYAQRPNKTQIKHEIAKVFAVAERLSGMTTAQWQALALPDNITEALSLAARLPATGARKRQLKFVTGLLRKMDFEALLQALDDLTEQSASSVYWHHQAEHWRDRLLTEGDSALQALMNEYPAMDSQRIRAWLRQARHQQDTGQAPKAARELYRYLKPQLSNL